MSLTVPRSITPPPEGSKWLTIEEYAYHRDDFEGVMFNGSSNFPSVVISVNHNAYKTYAVEEWEYMIRRRLGWTADADVVVQFELAMRRAGLL